MKDQRSSQKFFSISDLVDKFKKTIAAVSRSLKELHDDKLILKEGVYENYAHGPRLRISLTADGFQLAETLSASGITKYTQDLFFL